MIYNVKTKTLAKFTSLLIKKGKKSRASSIFFKTLFLLKRRTKKNPINFIYSAIKGLMPGVSTRKVVVAGRMYHLPCSITKNKALYFACNWLQQSAMSTKDGNKNLSLSQKISNECLKSLKKKGSAFLMLKQHNKTVSENRPFLRFVRRKRSPRLPRKVFLKRRKLLYLKRKKKYFNKPEVSYKLNPRGYFNKKYPHDFKHEFYFQKKIDRRFSIVDKKRNLSAKVSKMLKKNPNRVPKMRFKIIYDKKNKKFNKKN